MKTELQTLAYQDQEIRMVIRGRESWWVADDVCAVLEIANSRDAVAGLDEDEKGVVNTDTLGGPQQRQTVNESGLYSLIFKSRTPEAKAFKRWVTHEVLPSIRKTGAYPTTTDTMPDKFARMRQMLDLIDAQDARRAEQEQEVERLGLAMGFHTIRGYCKMHGWKVSGAAVCGWETRSGELCLARGIEPGTVADERYGPVGSYPVEVLDEVFAVVA